MDEPTEELNRGRPRTTFGTILMAAMIGLADALGWDRPRDRGEIVQLAPDLDTGDLPLDFGPLPPLDS